MHFLFRAHLSSNQPCFKRSLAFQATQVGLAPNCAGLDHKSRKQSMKSPRSLLLAHWATCNCFGRDQLPLDFCNTRAEKPGLELSGIVWPRLQLAKSIRGPAQLHTNAPWQDASLTSNDSRKHSFFFFFYCFISSADA